VGRACRSRVASRGSSAAPRSVPAAPPPWRRCVAGREVPPSPIVVIERVTLLLGNMEIINIQKNWLILPKCTKCNHIFKWMIRNVSNG